MQFETLRILPSMSWNEIKPNYVLLVTSQSVLAVQDTIKSKALFDRLNIPVLGLIDNMSYSICTHCNEVINEFIPVNLEKEIGLNVLGSIPRDKDLANFNSKKTRTLFEAIYNELIKLLWIALETFLQFT